MLNKGPQTDCPIKNSVRPKNLTEKIIEKPLRTEILRGEIHNN